MQKPVSHMSLLCTIYIQRTCILLVHYTTFFTHSKFWILHIHPQSSVPDLAPLNLVLPPQSLTIQQISTDTQLPREYDNPNLDGYTSPCHHQAVTQICH
ncbi:Hypothetical predicted protein [Scomber scombrus]|uniref:Uncharacterized protein n=1 Tax=Scomber scombrus TaxID=13677 RepID=A0AAV1N450_SCOSC